MIELETNNKTNGGTNNNTDSKSVNEKLLEQVVMLEWEESERGWGARPDGYSLHLNIDDCNMYIEKYWDSMPDKAPDEYSRPAGEPCNVNVSNETYKKLQESKIGLRIYSHEAKNYFIKKEV